MPPPMMMPPNGQYHFVFNTIIVFCDSGKIPHHDAISQWHVVPSTPTPRGRVSKLGIFEVLFVQFVDTLSNEFKI